LNYDNGAKLNTRKAIFFVYFTAHVGVFVFCSQQRSEFRDIITFIRVTYLYIGVTMEELDIRDFEEDC